MPVADFEEKEFEIPLYMELADGSPYVWSPGQVLEKRLGFDGSQLTRNPTFWKIIGRNVSPIGIALNPIAPSLNIFYRQLPSFRCNLMLQIKRPHYLKRRTLGYSGASPYYRFTIDNNQQLVLANLANKLGNRAYLAYASPAFWKPSDLYRYTVYSSLIQNSTFIRVIRLTHHDHWAYCCPGVSGQGYSEPENIGNEEPFLKTMEQMAEEDRKWKSEHESENLEKLATQNLNQLAQQTYLVCKEESESSENLAGDTLSWINDSDSSWDKGVHSAIRDFAVIQLFCSVYVLALAFYGRIPFNLSFRLCILN